MKKLLLAASAAVLAVGAASQASAASFSTQAGSATTFAGPAGGTKITFDAALPAGFGLVGSNAGIVQGSSPGNYAQPAFSDGSKYLAVLGGGAAALGSTAGFQSISLYLGSIDSYNSLSLLDTMGRVIATYPGYLFAAPSNGNQSSAATNQRVTFYRSEGDALLGGFAISSQFNAAEVDNVVFAVPEPSTWALMFIGFGLVGMAMRARRRNSKVVLA